MRCENCQGTGLIRIEYWCPNLKFYVAPCDDCGGTGISYCCDDAGVNQPSIDVNIRRDEGKKDDG